MSVKMRKWTKKGLNLGVGFMIIVFYSIITLMFVMPGSPLTEQGFTTNIDLNSTDLTSSEIDDSAGLFNTGISLSRFFDFVQFALFGIGLPGDVPKGIQVFLSLFFISFAGFTLKYIIDGIWSG